jgi:hypothetical protein
LARAWDVLEERKRILRGVPLPGSFQPSLDGVAQSGKWIAKLKAAKAAKQALEQSKMIDLPAIEGPPPATEKGIS